MDNSRDHEAALILLMLDAPSIGPAKLMELLKQHGTAEAALAVLRTSKSERIQNHIAQSLVERYYESIQRTYELGGNYKLWTDADYPSNLARWNGRPPVLFYKGDLSLLGDRSLALVGRVDPTNTGLDSARRFARKCVEHGITVVSGLAKGIDAESHASALAEPPGVTYAVIGHGLDHRYPKENVNLYERIPAHGAVISQFATGVGPQRWTFPARNEVMCTLALGTVIVEGKAGCGSIIQADFSFKHGRPVFLLAKNLQSGDSRWARELVERGAHVIERFDQVLAIVEQTLGERWDRSGRQRARTHAQTLFDVGAEQRRDGYSDTAVLFDLDGVVIDSRAATARSIAHMASRHLGKTVTTAEIDVTVQPHVALSRLGVQNAYQVYRHEYDSTLRETLDSVRVFDEVVDGIRKLKAQGVRVGAVTAQPARRVHMLVPPYIQALFEELLCYNDTRGKKDVGITTALARLGVAKGRAMYVGDTPRDLEAARRAGVKGVGVLWGFTPEHELQKFPHEILLDDKTYVGPRLVTKILGV